MFLTIRNVFCILYYCHMIKLSVSYKNILSINKLFYIYVLTEGSGIHFFFKFLEWGFIDAQLIK